MDEKDLICPHHDARLVLKEVKQGKNKGTKFYGCPTWNQTKCSYTVPYKSKKKPELTLKQKFLSKIKKQGWKDQFIKSSIIYLNDSN